MNPQMKSGQTRPCWTGWPDPKSGVLIKGGDVDPDAHRTTPRGHAGRDGGEAPTGQGMPGTSGRPRPGAGQGPGAAAPAVRSRVSGDEGTWRRSAGRREPSACPRGKARGSEKKSEQKDMTQAAGCPQILKHPLPPPDAPHPLPGCAGKPTTPATLSPARPRL